MKVKIYVNPSYNENILLIFNTIQQLLEVSGFLSILTSVRSEADIIYSPDYSNKYFFCLQNDRWSNNFISNPIVVGKYTIPDSAVCEKNFLKVDWIYVSYFFLSGLYEYQHTKATNLDEVENNVKTWNLCEFSPVDHCRSLLVEYLASINIPIKPAPRWPNNKKWALCISHDCDRFFKYRTQTFFKDSLFCFKNKNLFRGTSFLLKTIYSCIKNFSHPNDPYFSSWLNWLNFELKNDISSTNFISTFNRYDDGSTFLDVDYNHSNINIVEKVKMFKNLGFDFGLHTTTGAWDSKRYDLEANNFLSAYGFKPSGYRGHYWSISSDNPSHTMELVNDSTSLNYSSSFGMNKTYGYRRGVSYPYRPYNFETGAYSGNYEIPPILMDQCMYYAGTNNFDRINFFKEKVFEISRNNGCFVLDWHSDSLDPNYMDNITQALLLELNNIIHDSDCWVTSLDSVFEWCKHDRWKSYN